MPEKPEWQLIAEKMTGVDDLERLHPRLFTRLRLLDGMIKEARPWGGLRSSQVIAVEVVNYRDGDA